MAAQPVHEDRQRGIARIAVAGELYGRVEWFGQRVAESRTQTGDRGEFVVVVVH